MHIREVLSLSRNPIYPLAFEILPERKDTVYYLGFPSDWKKKLFAIRKAAKPHSKAEYGLPTNSLKKLVNSWMDGIASLRPLRENSSDERWLSAYEPFSDLRLKVLCGIIKVWITAEYIANPKVPAAAKDMAKQLCEQLDYNTLALLRQTESVCLTNSDGTVSAEAYDLLPLIAMNMLLGNKLDLGGKELTLRYAGKNELISQPIEDVKTGHFYSFVFHFSVQTTPPERKALLLCDMSIRRWAPNRKKPIQPIRSSNAINVHVYIGNNKYCQLPVAYSRKKSGLDWKEQDKECYDLWGYEPLLDVENLWDEAEARKEAYLIPYKNGMPSFAASKIGVGVSAKDKASLYGQIQNLLGDFAVAVQPAESVGANTIPFYSSPQSYADRESFREWVASCAETKQITFEIYGLIQDPLQHALMKRLRAKLLDDFGENTSTSCMTIDINLRDAGDLQSEISNPNERVQRIKEIMSQLGTTTEVVACLFLLPSAESYKKEYSDPKQVLRNAFACSGRVVQFIVPNDTVKDEQIHHAVYDLYRQLGVTTLIDMKKAAKNPLLDVPCIGMHICTQVQGISNKGRFLPLTVETDLRTGRTTVQCSAFEGYRVSYREACIEMGKLFWKSDLEKRCVSASFSPAKQVLLDLRNKYRTADSVVVLIVNADGNSRPLWGGISDKEIGAYTLSEDYVPDQINVGTKESPYAIPLTGTGVRVIRIRNNGEVPDYFTAQRDNCSKDNPLYSSASGLFRYGKVFYGVAAKPNDPRFRLSFIESKVDHPTQDFAEKTLQEFYPVQMQKGDIVLDWIRYVNAMRLLPIQYDQATSLPLPLHLAKGLEEYLFTLK